MDPTFPWPQASASQCALGHSSAGRAADQPSHQGQWKAAVRSTESQTPSQQITPPPILTIYSRPLKPKGEPSPWLFPLPHPCQAPPTHMHALQYFPNRPASPVITTRLSPGLLETSPAACFCFHSCSPVFSSILYVIQTWHPLLNKPSGDPHALVILCAAVLSDWPAVLGHTQPCLFQDVLEYTTLPGSLVHLHTASALTGALGLIRGSPPPGSLD